jgi:ABC-2 type transport system ATP-binding protein
MSTAAASPAIRTTDLGRQFGAVRALDQLTLEIPRGIIFGFLGSNGSGKTTTIRLLLGLLEPSTGSAQVLGCDVRTAATEIRQRSGALLEHCGLYERLSAADNLELYGRFWHLAPAARRAWTEELLVHLDLWDRRDELVAGLTTHKLAEAERHCALVGVVRNGMLLAVAPPVQLNATRTATRMEIMGSGLTDPMLATVRALPGVTSAHVDGRCLIVELRAGAEVAPMEPRESASGRFPGGGVDDHGGRDSHRALRRTHSPSWIHFRHRLA